MIVVGLSFTYLRYHSGSDNIELDIATESFFFLLRALLADLLPLSLGVSSMEARFLSLYVYSSFCIYLYLAWNNFSSTS